MACMGVQCGGRETPVWKADLLRRRESHSRGSMVFPGSRGGFQRLRASDFAADCGTVEKRSSAAALARFNQMEMNSVGEDRNSRCAKELDQWIHSSVSEIVKHIGEAPFLVHVFNSEGRDGSNASSSTSRSTAMRLTIEKATTETWPFVRRRWEDGKSMPDGVILVEELRSEEEEDEEPSVSRTKVWGVLVQGRGLSIPACYVLKTSRIRCCLGFCTHFCLSKVECSGKSLDFYLNRLWLQR